MEHVIAILGISALCGLWVYLQIASGRPCRSTCAACERQGGCSRGGDSEVSDRADDGAEEAEIAE